MKTYNLISKNDINITSIRLAAEENYSINLKRNSISINCEDIHNINIDGIKVTGIRGRYNISYCDNKIRLDGFTCFEIEISRNDVFLKNCHINKLILNTEKISMYSDTSIYKLVVNNENTEIDVNNHDKLYLMDVEGQENLIEGYSFDEYTLKLDKIHSISLDKYNKQINIGNDIKNILSMYGYNENHSGYIQRVNLLEERLFYLQ